MITRSDSGKNQRASFVIGNSLVLRHLTTLVTHVLAFFTINGYLYIIHMKH